MFPEIINIVIVIGLIIVKERNQWVRGGFGFIGVTLRPSRSIVDVYLTQRKALSFEFESLGVRKYNPSFVLKRGLPL